MSYTVVKTVCATLIDLLELRTFIITDDMQITSRHEEATRIQQLEAQQCKYTLNRERTAVNEIAIEKLVLLSRIINMHMTKYYSNNYSIPLTTLYSVKTGLSQNNTIQCMHIKRKVIITNARSICVYDYKSSVTVRSMSQNEYTTKNVGTRIHKGYPQTVHHSKQRCSLGRRTVRGHHRKQ